MDPITQGALGAAASQSFSRGSSIRVATVLGVAGGMAPDLDVLIRSSTDPLLALEYHRQFTHSLIFIPLGALLCAAVIHLIYAKKVFSFWVSYGFCFAGYATHALLDACTTYGTLLLWPFSEARISWNVVSVVDPLFTVPALCLILLAVIRSSRKYTHCAIVWMIGYLLVGVVQNNRAADAAEQLAFSRGHTPINLGVKPSFANLLVWKSVYEYQGRYYVDAVRVVGESRVITGSSTQKLALAKHFSWLDLASQQAKDIERFRWFSNGYLGLDPNNPARIIDIRYSLLPNEMTGMWGISISPEAAPDQHASYTTARPQGGEAWQKVQQLWSMVVAGH